MPKATDVNNCFDAAFVQVKGEHPLPGNALGPFYSMDVANVQRVLLLTQACLSSKGWIFTFDKPFINNCIPETVLKVLQDISANTKQKGTLPLVAATAKKPTAAKKKKKPQN